MYLDENHDEFLSKYPSVVIYSMQQVMACIPLIFTIFTDDIPNISKYLKYFILNILEY